MERQTVSPQVVKALAQFAAKDESRPALARVRIEHGHATACDGFILGTAKVNTNGFAGNVNPAQLLNVAKTVKRCNEIELVTDASEPRAVAMGQDAANWGPLTVTDESYPDRLSVIPDPEETDITFAIGPSLLAQLAAAAKAVDGQTVNFRFRGPNQGIRFAIRGGTETISGVLMPMIIGEEYDWTQR